MWLSGLLGIKKICLSTYPLLLLGEIEPHESSVEEFDHDQAGRYQNMFSGVSKSRFWM